MSFNVCHKFSLWNTEEEELSIVHRLNNIVRYNTRNKIVPETVAAHSFFTSYFVLSICEKHKINDDIKLMALESAVVHDIPEVFINDITYDCKQLVGGIEDMLKPYEEAIIKKLSYTARKILFEDVKKLTPSELLARAIVELADILSVKQYALSELELGNTTFKSILEGSERRLSKARLDFDNAAFLYNNSILKGNK